MACPIMRIYWYKKNDEWGTWDTRFPHPQPFVINTLRPRQHGRNFADDTFKRIFLNENVTTSIKISLKFVPKGSINNIPALVQIMAWRRPGDKPLSEAMMVSLLTHICVTRPQWVKTRIRGPMIRCFDVFPFVNHRRKLLKTAAAGDFTWYDPHVTQI